MSKQFLPEPFAHRKLRAADVRAHGGLVEHWLPFLEYLEVEAYEPNAEDCARQQAASPPQVFLEGQSATCRVTSGEADFHAQIVTRTRQGGLSLQHLWGY